jgi:aspartate-semialdehyde dehydrogenase
MSVFAILHPSGLLGQELREALEGRGAAGDEIRLLTTVEAEVGTLTELFGAAALVQRYDEGDLDRVDVAFFLGAIERNRPLLAALPAATTAVVLSPDAAAADGRPAVAGVNDEVAAPGAVLLSPHPAVVLLAHLLAPLRPFDPQRAAATLLQPASAYGQEGLDELFDQTRAILAFSPDRSQAVFGRQLAFNHYPATPGGAQLGELVRQILGGELPLTAQLLQGGAFHGLSASLFVRFGEDPGGEALRQALERHPPLAFAGGQSPAPVDAAASREILLGALEADPHEPGSYWLWAVMDNLTVGGALNALGIAETVLAQSAAGA